MGTLKMIQFFQNGIREEGMAELIKSFAFNKCLHTIKINDNLIKDSAPHLIDVLPGLSELKVIDISDSLLGNEHSLKIFQVFSVNFFNLEFK
jgi:Ran GTPase-activating protein (RanGAP) involved in mRNA processing and transport